MAALAGELAVVKVVLTTEDVARDALPEAEEDLCAVALGHRRRRTLHAAQQRRSVARVGGDGEGGREELVERREHDAALGCVVNQHDRDAADEAHVGGGEAAQPHRAHGSALLSAAAAFVSQQVPGWGKGARGGEGAPPA